MLFTRIIPSFLLASVAFASSPSLLEGEEQRFTKEKRLTLGLSASAEASISSALQTATTTIESLGSELKTAVEGVAGGDAEEVVDAVGGILTDITAAVQVCASACVDATLQIARSKRSLDEGSVDLNSVAALVAGLLNTLLAALAPLIDLIESTPGLGPLLQPFLSPLTGQLVILLNTLFAVVVGLLNVVLTLLDGTVAPLLRALDLGPLLSILTL
ncbi:hypothetical protein JCM11251_002894 [Rhodosporidiobolus azoricus]